MRTFDFEASQLLPRSREEIFGFFSNAANLESITPPWLIFHIASPEPIHMREGALIDNLFVRRDVKRIFAYRARQLEQRFQTETRKPVA